jgi:OOP family OmpA-OmpF porin
MQSNTIGKALIFFLGVFIAGCATPQFQPAPFTPHRFDPDQYAPKVDNFLILFDASSSMTLGDYKGTPKINIAKDLVYRLNQTIPELRMKAGMRAFGQSPAVGPGDTALVYGIADYRRALEAGHEAWTGRTHWGQEEWRGTDRYAEGQDRNHT